MSVPVVVPELGESVLEATIAHWLKQEGDQVAVGEPLVELETDKVNLEVAARQSGVLKQIQRKEQEDVKVGDVIGMIEEGEAPAAGESGPAKQASPAASAAPQPAEEPKEANQAGTAGTAGNGGQAAASEKPAEPSASSPEVTPVAQRLVQDLGIDVSKVTGTGPGGRITRGDVEGYAQKQATPDARTVPAQAAPAVQPQPAAQQQPSTAPVQAASLPAVSPSDRREERIKMSRRRRTIAQRLVEVQQTAAMLTTFNEVDMAHVMDLRKRRGESFQAHYGVKLGMTSFFVKAVIGALKDFPLLNAEVQGGDEMLIKYYYDIGIAVGSAEGLVVPVLRDADRLSFAGIEKRISEFVQKSEAGKLTLEDLRGGTFSITNGGIFGSMMSTPILTPPQVGILGMHKIEKRPVVVDDQIVIRPMMYLAVSYDHRIVDGREAVQFLVRIKQLIEDPEAMLLEG